MICHSSSSSQGKLKNCGCGSPNEVLPEDGIDVGAIRVLPARISLPRPSTMVGVVQLDQEAMCSVPLLLHVNEDTTAAVGETIRGVDVVNKHNLRVDLDLEDCLEWCVLDAPGIVRAELLLTVLLAFLAFMVNSSPSISLSLASFLALTLAFVP